MREESFRITPRPEKQSNALIIVLIGFASSCIVAGYLTQDHSTVAVLFSLLRGFAPIFGLGIFLVIDALVISFFIHAAEKIFAEEDDGIVPHPHVKSKWSRAGHSLPNLLAHRLSLNEHSPPAFLLFLRLVVDVCPFPCECP